MRNLFIAAVLLLASPLVGQEISAPAIANRGETIVVRISGVTLPAVAQEAAKAVLLKVDSPDETKPATIFGGVFWDFATGQQQVLIFFRADNPGVYVLAATAPKEAMPKIATARIAVGGIVPPTPDPQPEPKPEPKPEPNPKPEPPPKPVPPVVTIGPRLIILVREASAVGAIGARTEVSLRAGKCAEYLKSKGHVLLILSDDKGSPPNLSPVVRDAIGAAATIGKPTIIIADPTSTFAASILFSGPYLTSSTAEEISDIIKKYGG